MLDVVEFGDKNLVAVPAQANVEEDWYDYYEERRLVIVEDEEEEPKALDMTVSRPNPTPGLKSVADASSPPDAIPGAAGLSTRDHHVITGQGADRRGGVASSQETPRQAQLG